MTQDYDFNAKWTIKKFLPIMVHNQTCFFVCVEVFVPLENITHMKMSPVPVKDCKFWPMLGTYGHWAGKVLWHSTPSLTRGIRSYWSPPMTRDTHNYCRAFGSGTVTTCFDTFGLSRVGFEHLIFPLRGPTAPPPQPWYEKNH